MATLTFNGESFTVDHAVKGADYIHGFDADGIILVAFDGIRDFSGYSYDSTYMDPSDCLAEQCNEMSYCGGVVKTKAGAVVPASAIGAAAQNHGNHLYFQDNTFTTNGTNVTTITAPGKIVAVFINFRGQNSEWNQDLVYVPTSSRHAPFYCYGMINSNVEEWPMQLYWYGDNVIGVGRYQGNSAQFTCYCRTLYVQN